MPARRVALLVLITASVSWSGPLVRLAGDISPLAIAFWRTTAATAILFPFLIIRRRREVTSLSRNEVLLLIAAGGFLALHFAFWITSVNLTTVASSVLLVSSTPVFVAIGATFLGDRLPGFGWIGIGLALSGAGLVALADSGRISGAPLGNLLALLGAITVAGYVLIGRHIRRRRSILVYATTVYGVCAVIMGTAAVLTGTPLWGFGVKTWLVLTGITAGPQLLGHTIFNYLLEDMSAPQVTTVIMAEPLGSTLIAGLLFQELPGLLALPGAVILLMGIALVIRSGPRLPVPAET